MIIAADYTFAGHERWNLGWPSPNYAAAFLATVLPWCWPASLTAAWRGSRLKKSLIAGSVAIELLLWFALLETYSRGGVCAILAAGACYLIAAGRRIPRRRLILSLLGRGLYLATVVATIGFYARIGPSHLAADRSVSHRIDLWRGALKMIASSPWHGWGAGESAPIYTNWFQPIGSTEHYTRMVNSYLQVATEYGLPGLALIVAAGYVIGLSFRLAHRHPRSEIPGFIPLLAAAEASTVAWAVANIFTTLWLDYRLWAIPSVGILVSCLGFPFALRRSPLRHLAQSAGLGVVASGALWLAGIELSGKDEWSLRPGSDHTVIAIRRPSIHQLSRNSPEQDWQIWPDPAVLGPTPGQEIRLWLHTVSVGTCFVVHPAAPTSVHDKHFHGIALFGRQAERYDELLHHHVDADETWLIHPFCSIPPNPVAGGKIPGLHLLLPEIDEQGQGDRWRTWSIAHKAEVSVSPGVGADIRAAWPRSLDPIGPGPLSPTMAPMVVDSEPPSSLPGPDRLPDRQMRFWRTIQSEFQSIRLDGTWRLSYRLRSNRILQTFGFGCRLDQEIEVDSNGYPRTVWTIPALRTWLAPQGRQYLEFMPPDGTPVRFTLAAIGDKFGLAGSSTWKIRRVGPKIFHLLSPDGTRWEYVSGRLDHIEHATLGGFAVQTRGGSISEIRHAAPAATAPVLSASYDETGNPVLFSVSSGATESFAWTKGNLTGWRHGSDAGVRFAYADGLIVKVSEPGRPPHRVWWSQNAHFRRGDTSWYGPVSLQADDFYEYTYGVTEQGYRIVVKNRATGRQVAMLFNPMRHQLRQITPEGRVSVVTFQGSGADMTPQRAETIFLKAERP